MDLWKTGYQDLWTSGPLDHWISGHSDNRHKDIRTFNHLQDHCDNVTYSCKKTNFGMPCQKAESSFYLGAFFFSNLSYYDWEKGEFQETTKSVDRHVTVRALDVEQAVSVCGSKVSAVLVASGRLQWQQGGGHKWSQALRPLDGILGEGTGTSSKTWGCFQVRFGLDSLGKVFLEHPMNTSFKSTYRQSYALGGQKETLPINLLQGGETN